MGGGACAGCHLHRLHCHCHSSVQEVKDKMKVRKKLQQFHKTLCECENLKGNQKRFIECYRYFTGTDLFSSFLLWLVTHLHIQLIFGGGMYRKSCIDLMCQAAVFT